MCLEKFIYASMYKSLCIKLDQLHNLSLLVLHLQGYMNLYEYNIPQMHHVCLHGITPQGKFI